MVIYIITDDKKLITYNLPLVIKGNYWVSINEKNNKINLFNIYESNNQWLIHPNNEFSLYENGQAVTNSFIQENNFYFLKNIEDNSIITLFFSSTLEEKKYYEIKDNAEIIIGSNPQCNIYYNNSQITDIQAKISKVSNMITITNLNNSKADIFVNKNLVAIPNYQCYHGDSIFLLGLKIVIIGNILIVNNPLNKVQVNFPSFDKNLLFDEDEILVDDDSNMSVYNKDDYFSRSPQFRSAITTLNMKVDSPPQKEKEDDTPTVLVIGPMVTMGMISVVMLYSALSSVATSDRGFSSAIPQIVMAIAMLGTILFWPILTKRYRKRKYYENEEKRKDKYEKYIQTLHQEIEKNITSQRQILMENHISVDECVQIILNKNTRLWGREIEDNDFLVVRLGLGNVPLDIKLSYQEEGFTLEDDVLKEILKNLIDVSHDITGAPVTVSLFEKRLTGVVGNYYLTAEFLKGILIQLLTFYSGDLLKIVILTNSEKEHNWSWLKELGHCWDNERVTRFFATSNDDAIEVFKYLEKMYDYRVENTKDDKNTRFAPYFLIICDDYKAVSENKFIKKLLTSNSNYGFSMIILSNLISTLPNKCNCFININKDVSGLIENELVLSKQKEFITEFVDSDDILKCMQILANIPIAIESHSQGLPDSYGLLEMYNVGKVEGLNSFNRWRLNDSTVSLSVPIGIDNNGDIFKLDLHEKFHGPHGLIAGMTGSGKSEFIITLVLSLAINYHPNEVSFILIDYKGGGSALAFENKELGIRLPHIAGTITNLDVTELNRALSSIEAELKRRQKEFNIARNISGESTIDIYKYQKLYHEGVVQKPIPHLFVICDEFAELKTGQPEFMDQLISTARIGRALGVHLILATQKPSGIVNDQIWSNAKFKVCLKVQDKADSKDMIQVPDAAELKQVGRFYLLVGYNDYFAMGQSAYCGMPYIPSDVIKKSVDTSINFINNVGYVIKSVDDVKTIQNEAQGEVLLNVVKYLAKIAKEENIVAERLWLDRIPNIIYVDNLIKKYNYQKENYVINPVIGEYDDPTNQRQCLLTLPISKYGNTLIYGMAGSGKEDLLTTLIYSLITNYTTEEINLYIMDCGAETLKIFNKAPQIGDVIFGSESEKINNCFNMLNDIFLKRKKILADYNGDINVYNELADKKLPFIICIINSYENFVESYEKLEDNFIKLTRDAIKSGIIFLATCSSINGMRIKAKQNFSYSICLRLNEIYDYVNIFGSKNKVIPSDNKGRGLIKIDNIYEFQSASICEEKKKLKYINDLCKKLNEYIPTKAPKVPILPDKVTFDYFNPNQNSLEYLPIGIEKISLKPTFYNFKEPPVNLVLSSAIKNMVKFVNGLIQTLSKLNNTNTIVLDSSHICPEKIEGVNYYDQDFNDIAVNVIKLIEKSIQMDKPANNIVIVIVGINNILGILNNDIKQDFMESISKVKNISFVRFIFVESVAGIKSYIYEPWLKNNINQGKGIWIGKGLAEQTTLQTSGVSYRDISQVITNDMGYVIDDGTPTLVKLIEYDDEENDKIEVL